MELPAPIAELRQILPQGHVVTDPAELFVYESDGLTIANARPAAVVFPISTQQTQAVVNVLARHDLPIVPRGSGTGLAGGCVAYGDGVIVCTARMNRILQIDLNNRAAHVQAGVRNLALSEALAQLPGGSAWHFAPDPSSQRASTIGGNASTNAGGIHTLKDFVTSNHILGIEMVMPDGQVLHAGGRHGACADGPFDLPGLICGHEGTFGIITSLWVRLSPKAAGYRTAVVTFSSTADACNTVSDIIAAGHLPAAMEMLDGAMIQILEDAFHFGFSRQAQALVLLELDGIDELLDGQLQEVLAICRGHNPIAVESSADPARRAALWKARKSAFGAIGRVSHSYCTQDACVPRSRLADVLAEVARISREHGIPVTNVFHAGDGNIHPIFLFDDRDQAQVRNTLAAADKMLEYCVSIGGTLTGEHGIGVEKVHLMPLLFDEPTIRQFLRIRAAFDPHERLNTGKFMPGGRLTIRLVKPGRQAPQ